jgi:hypothetical protein
MRWSKETTRRLPPRCQKRTDHVMDITSADQDASLDTNPSLAESPEKCGAVGWYMAHATSVQDSYCRLYLTISDSQLSVCEISTIRNSPATSDKSTATASAYLAPA